MAIQSDPQILNRATQISNEVMPAANTKTRIGSILYDMWETLVSRLAGKANTADVTNALNQKANTADVTNALNQKANTDDVNDALAALGADIDSKATPADITTAVSAEATARADADADLQAQIDSLGDHGESYTFENGLTETDGVVRLGGQFFSQIMLIGEDDIVIEHPYNYDKSIIRNNSFIIENYNLENLVNITAYDLNMYYFNNRSINLNVYELDISSSNEFVNLSPGSGLFHSNLNKTLNASKDYLSITDDLTFERTIIYDDHISIYSPVTISDLRLYANKLQIQTLYGLTEYIFSDEIYSGKIVTDTWVQNNFINNTPESGFTTFSVTSPSKAGLTDSSTLGDVINYISALELALKNKLIISV